MYTSMGRGRNGLIEQSRKKPQKTVNKKDIIVVGERKFQTKNNTEFSSKDFLEALKRMEPKEVADILFK